MSRKLCGISVIYIRQDRLLQHIILTEINSLLRV